MSGAQDLPRQLEQARQLARLRQLRERNLVSGTGRLLRLPLALPEKAEGAWKLEAAASAGGESGKGGAGQGWPWH